MNIDKDKLRQWVNLILIFTAFGTNVLANIAPLNDLTIGEISTSFFPNVLIIPANYAFAIWGIIYLGLISLSIYQVLPAQRNHPRLRKMGYYLAVSSLSQIIWVFLFQSQLFVLSVVAMLGILVPLILLYLRLEINFAYCSSSQRWLVNFPISLYFGWISVATVVNIASALEISAWNGWGISSLVWTAIILLIVTIVGLVVIWQRRDSIFGGVLIWAWIAIAFRQMTNPTLAIIVSLLAVILLITIILRKIAKVI